MEKTKSQPSLIAPSPGTLSRTRYYDYAGVSLDAYRSATVEAAKRYFGTKRYEEIRIVFQEAYPELAKHNRAVTFDGHAEWLHLHGIHGFAHAIAIGLEWGLEPFILDWDAHFDEWLDSCLEAKKVA
ncbi:hypothetical protein K3G63_14730 [Hymenobacter sp. HSC-4F20]|uniref:hypothetical protein n=1 Tax=Hymenobacter sp. HSC-4F20 TaxID=2864135 RepID=UPI001C73759D|nr:hypothetical protein [Hymenobacter sp. HSC-4F20]MBX0291703.1 hypothetical protein [Hymenobacter sp. HSC-4F20]